MPANRNAEDIIIVRRIGEPIWCAIGCLVVALLVLPPVYILFPYATIVAFLLICYFFLKSLPHSTLFDMANRNVRIRPNGWKTETISFDDIYDIRTVARDTGSGYCLRLKNDPLFDCRIISDLTAETPYTREFRLQIVPRIRLALADDVPDPVMLPVTPQTCFMQKGDQWERTLPSGFLPERRHLVDPTRHTIEISRGVLFLQKSKTFSFDDLEAVCIRISDRATKSVYLRFTGDKFLYFVAHDRPEKLRGILACYASVMNTDLSGKIEYIA